MKRWKGYVQSEKQYNRRLKQVESGKRRKKKDETEAECVVEGRRIIDLKVMSQHMYCTFCKKDLCLKDIKKEEKYGLASIFFIICQHCLSMSKVPTGTQHPGLNNKMVYDINTKSALGKLYIKIYFL